MKKLLLGSATLTIFALSIAIFQIACQKETTAQQTQYTLVPATTATLGGVIVGNGLNVSNNGTLSVASSAPAQQNKILFVKSFDSGPTEVSEIWNTNINFLCELY